MKLECRIYQGVCTVTQGPHGWVHTQTVVADITSLKIVTLEREFELAGEPSSVLPDGKPLGFGDVQRKSRSLTFTDSLIATALRSAWDSPTPGSDHAKPTLRLVFELSRGGHTCGLTGCDVQWVLPPDFNKSVFGGEMTECLASPIGQELHTKHLYYKLAKCIDKVKTVICSHLTETVG